LRANGTESGGQAYSRQLIERFWQGSGGD